MDAEILYKMVHSFVSDFSSQLRFRPRLVSV